MVDVVLHEHLVVFELLDGRDVALDLARGRLDRELDDLRAARLGVLPDLGVDRIAELFADAAERIARRDADAADVVRRVRVVDRCV